MSPVHSLLCALFHDIVQLCYGTVSYPPIVKAERLQQKKKFQKKNVSAEEEVSEEFVLAAIK